MGNITGIAYKISKPFMKILRKKLLSQTFMRKTGLIAEKEKPLAWPKPISPIQTKGGNPKLNCLHLLDSLYEVRRKGVAL